MTETITVEEITTVPAKRKKNWKRIAIVAGVAVIGGAVALVAISAAGADSKCEDENDSDASDSDTNTEE